MRLTILRPFVICLVASYAAFSARAQAPAATPATTKSSASASSSSDTSEDYKEKALISRGYRLKTRNGQRVLCRREAALGTHFEKEICDTAENIYARGDSDRSDFSTMQRNQPLRAPGK